MRFPRATRLAKERAKQGQQDGALSGDERARLRELEREVAELRMERDVLKVRREALCRVPDGVGRNLEEHSWV